MVYYNTLLKTATQNFERLTTPHNGVFFLLCEWAHCMRGQGQVTEVTLTASLLIVEDGGRWQKVK